MADWLALDIPLARHTRARHAYVDYARALQRTAHQNDRPKAVHAHRWAILADTGAIAPQHQAMFRACVLILTDLVLQGWSIRIRRNSDVRVRPPERGADRPLVKAAIRSQEIVKRDAQLAKPSVRAFILAMECKRVFNGRFVSVFDLMRDGSDLAETLRYARSKALNGEPLRNVVKPYIEFVDSSARCQFTGLRLMDVWRYFRHTWTNQHTSVPGRTMLLLIRDAAAPNHPVMGIAALASPIIQISERDKWLGWHPSTFVERVRSQPSAMLARWLHTTVDAAIDEIYTADFIREKRITRWRIARPTPETIKRLRRFAVVQKKRHLRFARRSDFRAHESRQVSGSTHWKLQAELPLFRSKRAQSLADLLEIRAQLLDHFEGRYSAKALRAFVETADGRRVVAKVVRKAKADRVGVAMADITVCGAIQPYNALLGGKLVSMLAISPQVVAEYKRRYAQATSQIASSMAGRPIVRRPLLVYVGTTSLYGNGSSQYNRIKVPTELLGGRRGACLTFEKIGESESFGTSQFSDETIDALVECLRQSTNGERVHSIFGEGVSPRLRKVREGLALLGLPEDVLLQHGRRRSVYGVKLAENARDYLIGLDKRPNYLAPMDNPSATKAIVEWWRHRWLSGRIQSDRVLNQVAEHRHIRPMRHGARVELPSGRTEDSIESSV